MSDNFLKLQQKADDLNSLLSERRKKFHNKVTEKKVNEKWEKNGFKNRQNWHFWNSFFEKLGKSFTWFKNIFWTSMASLTT